VRATCVDSRGIVSSPCGPERLRSTSSLTCSRRRQCAGAVALALFARYRLKDHAPLFWRRSVGVLGSDAIISRRPMAASVVNARLPAAFSATGPKGHREPITADHSPASATRRTHVSRCCAAATGFEHSTRRSASPRMGSRARVRLPCRRFGSNATANNGASQDRARYHRAQTSRRGAGEAAAARRVFSQSGPLAAHPLAPVRTPRHEQEDVRTGGHRRADDILRFLQSSHMTGLLSTIFGTKRITRAISSCVRVGSSWPRSLPRRSRPARPVLDAKNTALRLSSRRRACGSKRIRYAWPGVCKSA